jgi:hypothetical protein
MNIVRKELSTNKCVAANFSAMITFASISLFSNFLHTGSRDLFESLNWEIVQTEADNNPERWLEKILSAMHQ